MEILKKQQPYDLLHIWLSQNIVVLGWNSYLKATSFVAFQILHGLI